NENRESTRLIRVIRTLLMSFQALKAVLLYRLRLLQLVFVQTSGAAAMVGTRVSRCATHAQDPPHIAPIDGKEYADKRGLRAKLAEKGSKATGGDAKAASTTLADLLTPPVVANPFSTMRASLRR